MLWAGMNKNNKWMSRIIKKHSLFETKDELLWWGSVRERIHRQCWSFQFDTVGKKRTAPFGLGHTHFKYMRIDTDSGIALHTHCRHFRSKIDWGHFWNPAVVLKVLGVDLISSDTESKSCLTYNCFFEWQPLCSVVQFFFFKFGDFCLCLWHPVYHLKYWAAQWMCFLWIQGAELCDCGWESVKCRPLTVKKKD